MNDLTSSELRSFSEGSISEIYYFDDPRNVKATGVSHDLFLFKGLTPSLTEYLTSPTRAKNLYVDADTFHTQMVEFCLERFLGPDGAGGTDEYIMFFIGLHKRVICILRIDKLKRKFAGTHWKFHLVQAQPSQKIFARLRVLSSYSFIEASQQPSNSFWVIITWLEVCQYIEQLLRLQVLTIPSRACPRHLSTFTCSTRSFY
jgi:hypothetical protein